MSISETIVNIARARIGKTRNELGLNRSTEWCSENVSDILNHVDNNKFAWNTVLSISCNDLRKNLLTSGLAYEPDDSPRAGDLLFINWGHDFDVNYPTKPLDHVAVITEYDGTFITYVDGNSDNSGRVQEHKYMASMFDFNCEYPDYYLRIKEDIDVIPVELNANHHSIVYNKEMLDAIHNLENAVAEIKKLFIK